jgi:hypothetical protein
VCLRRAFPWRAREHGQGRPATPKFPENRNLTGNFENFRLIPRFQSPIPAVISIRYWQIPCYSQNRKFPRNFNALQANSLRRKEQGIFRQEQGIFSREQGIHSS